MLPKIPNTKNEIEELDDLVLEWQAKTKSYEEAEEIKRQKTAQQPKPPASFCTQEQLDEYREKRRIWNKDWHEYATKNSLSELGLNTLYSKIQNILTNLGIGNAYVYLPKSRGYIRYGYPRLVYVPLDTLLHLAEKELK